MKKRWTVASEAGAQWHTSEKARAADFSEAKVGDEFEADLGAHELALVCAGWVVDATKKPKREVK